jgi:hypothetical protein
VNAQKKNSNAFGSGCDIYFPRFSHNAPGHCLVLDRQAVKFGEINADGSVLKITQTSGRDMDLGATLKFRLVIKDDMVELYVNEYLMNLKRVLCNGQIGFLGGGFQDISVWQCN